MSTPEWTDSQLDGFHRAAQSLKLYRRAELENASTGHPMIELLYVDPLPSEHVLATLLKSNTTFVIGRKGTGKSTVFQRAQHSLRQNRKCLTAYVDIKTIYETATTDPGLIQQLEGESGVLPTPLLEKLLVHQAFITTVVSEIRTELQKRVQSSLWDTVKEHFTGTIDMLFENLDELLEESKSPNFVSVLGSKRVARESKNETGDTSKGSAGFEFTLKPSPELKARAEGEYGSEVHTSNQEQYADILIRSFNIKELITQLQQLLDTIGVKTLYVFVDDFSELPQDAMVAVVDALLAPLNNWSNELVKFKIAAYPGRIYYGAIDKTKIDEIYLDTYKLYGTSDVGAMEEKSIDFTKRLVEKRIESHCDGSPSSLFLDTAQGEFWRTLFYASMANPRILGYLLFYVYESHLIYGQKVGIKAIRDASRKYYEDKLEPYFRMNRFLHQSFGERSSVLGMRELLESIVFRARELRSHSSDVMQKIPGRPPTSHFHVLVDLESLLSTLELNFFLSKYYEMKDRDGRKVSVFAINYGLCQKSTISFGRPTGDRVFRLYFVERIFDYTPILQKYIASNQEIVCDACHEIFDIDQLQSLKMYSMLCPQCKKGTCQVINLTKKYEDLLETIDNDLLLPATELGILQTLHSESTPLFANDIAGELDCSYQLVGKRAKKLNERGLLERKTVKDPPNYNRRQFTITTQAEEAYFGDAEQDDLNID